MFPVLSDRRNIVVIADEKVPDIFLMSYPKILISSGEINKNINTVQIIWQRLLDLGADRKTLVINLGGGVIGDMGGFAASTYMRGIPFIQIPTTLLSMVDASVGGKTAIDVGGVKNSVGAFQQPRAVIIDTAHLHTLPIRERNAGFAEIIKHGLIADQSHLARVYTSIQNSNTDEVELHAIIHESVLIKKSVVESDPTEKGKRKILNFGHTVGHAVESLSHEMSGMSPLLHGEAIAIGMVAEFELSCLQFPDLDPNHSGRSALCEVLGMLHLPTAVPSTMKPADILSRMKQDKKNTSGNISLVLLSKVGDAVYDRTYADAALLSFLSQR
jgi:3-dehydroquinate synthase